MPAKTLKKVAPIGDEQRAAADVQIKQLQREIKYDLRDFTVDYLVKSFKDDLFFIPPYQREFIWPVGHRCKFIESVILGLPIPMLFVADMADGRLEIVDGAQRIQTLEEFLSGDLALDKLELLTEVHGFRFLDLSIAQQRKLQTRALRLVVLEDGGAELETVKEQRNALAHGHKSFIECGRDYELDDISRILKQTTLFLKGFLASMDSYQTKKRYVSA